MSIERPAKGVHATLLRDNFRKCFPSVRPRCHPWVFLLMKSKELHRVTRYIRALRPQNVVRDGRTWNYHGWQRGPTD